MITFGPNSESGWVTTADGRHVPVWEGKAYPVVTGILHEMSVVRGPGYWVDPLAPQPTRKEQERLNNARLRAELERDANALGLSPERMVELLKDSGRCAEYVDAWEASWSP